MKKILEAFVCHEVAKPWDVARPSLCWRVYLSPDQAEISLSSSGSFIGVGEFGCRISVRLKKPRLAASVAKVAKYSSGPNTLLVRPST